MAAVASAADYLLPLAGRQQYQVAIEVRGVCLTGVCIVLTDDEGCRGAIVNEFGFHALDFTLTTNRAKVKLLNVMPNLNRWYIKRVVRTDLRFLFNATQDGQQKGRRTVTTEPDGTVTLVNDKYNLKYSLKRIDETSE